VKFVDRSFRLACLDILHDQGHFIAELEAIANSEITQNVEARLNAMEDLAITSEMLASITEFAPDGGDDIYFVADPEWGGENEEFYISRFDDIALLPNLGSLWVNAVAEAASLDLSLLLQCNSLVRLNTDSFYVQNRSDNPDILSTLGSRGVDVKVG